MLCLLFAQVFISIIPYQIDAEFPAVDHMELAGDRLTFCPFRFQGLTVRIIISVSCRIKDPESDILDTQIGLQL